MARGAGTWDAAKMSTIEESAKGMTKQRNSMYLTNTIRRKTVNRLSMAHGRRLMDLTAMQPTFGPKTNALPVPKNAGLICASQRATIILFRTDDLVFPSGERQHLTIIRLGLL